MFLTLHILLTVDIIRILNWKHKRLNNCLFRIVKYQKSNTLQHIEFLETLIILKHVRAPPRSEIRPFS